MAKWSAAEKARAELRHVSRIPERDDKNQEEDSPKQAGVLVRSPELISHEWRELVSSGRMSCGLSLVLSLFRFVSFSYFSFT